MKFMANIVFMFICIQPLLSNDYIDYVGIGISKQNIENNKFDSGTALTINTGKNNIYKDIGLELEGTLQLKKPSATINGVSSDLKFWSMGMYGTYLWKIDDITIKPRLGLVYESIKSSFNTSNSGPTKSINKNKVSMSAGIGLSYNITEQTKLYTNFTKFEDDIDHITFGAEFKF